MDVVKSIAGTTLAQEITFTVPKDERWVIESAL